MRELTAERRGRIRKTLIQMWATAKRRSLQRTLLPSRARHPASLRNSNPTGTKTQSAKSSSTSSRETFSRLKMPSRTSRETKGSKHRQTMLPRRSTSHLRTNQGLSNIITGRSTIKVSRTPLSKTSASMERTTRPRRLLEFPARSTKFKITSSRARLKVQDRHKSTRVR